MLLCRSTAGQPLLMVSARVIQADTDKAGDQQSTVSICLLLLSPVLSSPPSPPTYRLPAKQQEVGEVQINIHLPAAGLVICVRSGTGEPWLDTHTHTHVGQGTHSNVGNFCSWRRQLSPNHNLPALTNEISTTSTINQSIPEQPKTLLQASGFGIWRLS